jgi:hypothetical protein
MTAVKALRSPSACVVDPTRWKDWMAKLVEEYYAAHRGAALVNVESA